MKPSGRAPQCNSTFWRDVLGNQLPQKAAFPKSSVLAQFKEATGDNTNRVRKYGPLLIAGILVLLAVRGACAAGLEASMVIYNGKILTADSPDPKNFRVAQAAAIYGGRFIAVGTNEEALQYAGPGAAARMDTSQCIGNTGAAAR